MADFLWDEIIGLNDKWPFHQASAAFESNRDDLETIYL